MVTVSQASLIIPYMTVKIRQVEVSVEGLSVPGNLACTTLLLPVKRMNAEIFFGGT